MVFAGAARAGVVDGIGVIGDSYSDEYQFYPVDRTSARNWVEILAEARGLNFGKFSTGGRGEPRNQGYEFNWARSGATTDDVIAGGQHTGLAAQAARGEVTLACVFVGGNDFIFAMKSPDPAEALREVLPRALRNYRTIVDTVLNASPDVKVVLTTLPDVRDLPELAERIRTGALPQTVADAYTAAIEKFNAQIHSIGLRERRVAVMDLALAMSVANRLSREWVFVAGQRIDLRIPGNGPRHAFLADGRHLGTLGQGMLARLFIVTVNLRFKAGLAPLKDRDLLALAGLSAAPTPLDAAARLTDLVRILGGREAAEARPEGK